MLPKTYLDRQQKGNTLGVKVNGHPGACSRFLETVECGLKRNDYARTAREQNNGFYRPLFSRPNCPAFAEDIHAV